MWGLIPLAEVPSLDMNMMGVVEEGEGTQWHLPGVVCSHMPSVLLLPLVQRLFLFSFLRPNQIRTCANENKIGAIKPCLSGG